jgi:hypothetical protein
LPHSPQQNPPSRLTQDGHTKNSLLQSTFGQFLCGGGADRSLQQWHSSVAASAPASDAGNPFGVIASRESKTNR